MALTLQGEPYRLVERGSWKEVTANEEMARINPMRQIPALVLPPKGDLAGELMSESAAILTWLADSHPDSGLAPVIGSELRPRFRC